MASLHILVISCLITCSCSGLPASVSSLEQNEHIPGKTMEQGYIEHTRTRRGIVSAVMGLKAMLELLKGAKRVPEKNKFFKGLGDTEEFEKRGDYQQALYDFFYADVKNVKNYRYPNGNVQFIGRAGDKQVVVNKSGSHGNPSIEIIPVGGEKEQKRQIITYMGDKN